MIFDTPAAFMTDFAVDVVLDGEDVRGIFDAPGMASDLGLIGMATTAAKLTLPTADVPADPVGKTAVIGDAAYVVAQHLPDGTGMSVLVLDTP